MPFFFIFQTDNSHPLSCRSRIIRLTCKSKVCSISKQSYRFVRLRNKINGHLDMCVTRLYCILKGSIEMKKNNKNNCSTFSLQGHVVDVI